MGELVRIISYSEHQNTKKTLHIRREISKRRENNKSSVILNEAKRSEWILAYVRDCLLPPASCLLISDS